MRYGYYDKNKGVYGIIEGDFVLKNEKIKTPALGNIYRARLGKRLDFMNANEILLDDFEGLIFDRDRLDEKSDTLLVQLDSYGYDDKKPKLTEKIVLKGKYIIIDPYSKFVNISREIKNKSIRKDFINIFKTKKYGMIIRTGALNNIQKAIDEYNDLELKMDEIFSQKNFMPIPKLIYENKISIIDELKEVSILYTNDIALKDKCDHIEIIYDRNYSSEQDNVLQNSISQSLQRKISVKGAELVFDELEALTFIDVNSSKIKLKEDKTANAAYVNELVLKKILSQLVLRKIGGIVIIDFIRSDKENMDKLMNLIWLEIEKFNIKLKDCSYTNSGLMELIIKR